jgi:Uma2 family endonuclease
MSAIEKLLPYYTYEDFKHWEGKWEIIDGIPFAMAPSPVVKHQIIAGNLHALLWNELQNCPNDCKVYQPIDYFVKDDTILVPDLLVVCGDIINKKYLDFAPALVCEVLSPSTALKDRHTKYNIYQSKKIPYYIIISPITEEVEIFILNNKGEYELSQKGKDIKGSFNFDSCSVVIDFEKIW